MDGGWRVAGCGWGKPGTFPHGPLCQRGECECGKMGDEEGWGKSRWPGEKGVWLGEILRFTQDDKPGAVCQQLADGRGEQMAAR